MMRIALDTAGPEGSPFDAHSACYGMAIGLSRVRGATNGAANEAVELMGESPILIIVRSGQVAISGI